MIPKKLWKVAISNKSSAKLSCLYSHTAVVNDIKSGWIPSDGNGKPEVRRSYVDALDGRVDSD